MDDDATQQATQQVLDPRRLGRNNSGLSEPDISDVLCILHPNSPAAFRVVRATTQRNPQHILQNDLLRPPSADSQLENVEEQETFILGAGHNPENAPRDLALRFSSQTINPVLGFTFGRNPFNCDIVVDDGSVKRVSNLHFRIYVTPAGALMLQDMSTNGTMVDNLLLKGKDTGPAMRMLVSGSLIVILSPNQNEMIKFIVRIPSRDRHTEAYSLKFQAYMQRIADLEKQRGGEPETLRRGRRGQRGQAALPVVGAAAHVGAALKAPITSNYTFGMAWDGGDEYNVVGLLGKGAFAMVYRLATAMDGRELAAKELEKKRFIKNGQLDQKLDNELQILKSVSHPNIVQYMDYRDEKSHLYIIMEYVPCGDLQGYLADHGVLPEPAAKLVAAQILDALAYLHHKRITHRDIKPDNILIASEDPFVVKLSDFGLSKVVSNTETFLKTFCGTLLYCAPEVFPHYDSSGHKKGTKRRRGPSGKSDFHSYSQSVDIWSFAAVLWFALCGKPPFEGVIDNTGRGMFDKIMNTHLDPQALFDQGISPQAVDLLLKMLNTDPSKRPTELECLQHPWLAEVVASQPQYAQHRLNAIVEETEDAVDGAEAEPEVQLSQLSLHGAKQADDDASDDGAGDLTWKRKEPETLFPPRSKRVRPDLLVPRNQVRTTDGFDSSPEISYHTSLVDDGHSGSAAGALAVGPGRLFGEIGHSALQSSGLLGQHTNVALNMAQRDATTSADTKSVDSAVDAPSLNRHIAIAHTDGANEHDQALPPTEEFSPVHGSLLGAESMMRDITMGDSPQSVSSPANEPPTPKTPDFSQSSNRASQSGTQDITPKPQTSSFNRKIHLSQADFFDTENGDGRDFGMPKVEYPDISGSGSTAEDTSTDPPIAVALPATMHHSVAALATDGASDSPDMHEPKGPHTGELDGEPSAASSYDGGPNSDAEFRRPPPRLGKLTSTASSTGIKGLPIILRLEHRTTIWGRDPTNTHVFPDPLNTRIPKRGILIFFHALGIEKMDKEGGDVTKMEGLHTLITTNSKIGIWVNGVKLKLEEDGKTNYGRLYSGDIVTVFKDSSQGGARLEFQCEFYHGEAANPRPEGVPFKVLKS